VFAFVFFIPAQALLGPLPAVKRPSCGRCRQACGAWRAYVVKTQTKGEEGEGEGEEEEEEEEEEEGGGGKRQHRRVSHTRKHKHRAAVAAALHSGESEGIFCLSVLLLIGGLQLRNVGPRHADRFLLQENA